MEEYTKFAKEMLSKYGFLVYHTYKTKTIRKLWFSGHTGLDEPKLLLKNVEKDAKKFFRSQLIKVYWNPPFYPDSSSINILITL